MLRIAHLSDIHLKADSLGDIDNFIMKALINDLVRYNIEKTIDLIVFSGDLIDKGGTSFENSGAAYKAFHKHVISPIVKELNFAASRIFLSPGNHDVDRTADNIYVEKGLRGELSSIEKVNEYFNEPNREGNKRIMPFKQFEKEFYKDYPTNYKITDFQSSFSAQLADATVGITCFNSAWRSYDSTTDKGLLIIGENQVTEARKIIDSCDMTIAVMHHTEDWLSDFERKRIGGFLARDYQMLLCGHAHTGSLCSKTGMYGSLFIAVAPASLTGQIRGTDRFYANGYSIIDYDLDNMQITNHNRRYSYEKESYDPNPDLGDDQGITHFIIPDMLSLSIQSEESKTALLINNTYCSVINDHLLSFNTDTKAPKKLDDIFVEPRLTCKPEYNVEKDEVLLSVRQLCDSDDNMLIFGAKESGKTLLLDKILSDLTRDIKKSHKIPIYIDFDEVGNKRFETIIGRFTGVNITDIDRYLNNHKIVLLIDNISFNKIHSHKLNKLEELLDKFDKIRFIATCPQLFEGDIPLDILDYKGFASSKMVTIKSFRTKEIKELIRKWFIGNENYDTPDKFDKVLNVFRTLNLPRTPLAISMFLWIIEQQENYKPVNHATMLENFIEKIFKKLSAKEIYSETFDYRNKERILADLAHFMYETGQVNYRVTYQETSNFINDLLKKKKFDFQAIEVLEHFLAKGILIKENDDAEVYVRFRFTCFFQYFLMKKMDFDGEFRKHVLREENYLFFSNEIDYFTGLKRDRADILTMCIERMNREYAGILGQILKIPQTFDNVFETGKTVSSTLNEDFVKHLAANKPKEEELDKITDEMLDKTVPEKGIKKKEIELSTPLRMERMWTLAAQVLKNTEEITEPELKVSSYRQILTCSMAFSNLYKYHLENFIKKNQGNLGAIKIDENILIVKKFLPLVHEIVLYSLLGTPKLSAVIRDKIHSDLEQSDLSDLEKYLSVFLYADIRGKDYDKYIKDFVKQIRRSYIYDMTLFKLVSYYFLRSKTKQSDLYYEDIIAELICNARGLKKSKKSSIISDYKEKKKRILEDNKSDDGMIW